MRLGFRAKLMTIVGSAALAFLVIVAVSLVTANRVAEHLAIIETRHMPKLALEPKLEADFEALRRGFQDAVAARDADALERTHAAEAALLADLDAARSVFDPAAVSAVRGACEDYITVARDVSRRLIAAETGEGLVDGMAQMQEKQARAVQLLRQATTFDRRELEESFSAARRVQESATTIRIAVVVACLSFVLVLSMWLSRGTIASLEALVRGFTRFGTGQLDAPIVVRTRDELADLAEHANAMAESLKRVVDERERTAWLKSGQAGLAEELRGELEPGEVAGRAISFLARHLEAPAAALYVRERDGRFQLLGRYAHSLEGEDAAEGTAAPATSFAPGDGLVGQAALIDGVTVVADPPAGYLRVRSGLGEASPRAIVLVPIVHDAKVNGVMELALFNTWSDRSAELLLSVRAGVGIAIEVARARAAMRRLLAETQNQALRLATQEERLRATNEELQVQQEELRATNEELTSQASILETQRRVLEEKNEALRETRTRLEQKAEELTSVSAYKSQFLANMSHELRTPLNSMLLLSQLLAENEGGNLTSKQVEFAKTIFGAGTDLLALINQVLDLAKVESGKQQMRIEEVPLRELTDQMQRVFGPLAGGKGLTFAIDVSEAAPESIPTDRQRIVQILNNLLGNAVKFTQRGKITLHVGPPAPGARLSRDDVALEGMLAFSVIDTGVGIAPEHRVRIFAPFEQVEAAADRRYGGTGLGLAIARELAVLLGGELQLSSTAGEGSTFVLYLPRQPGVAGGAPAQRVEEARPAARVAAPPVLAPPVADDRASLRPGDDHLLVIEDDRAFASVLGDVIRGFGLRYVVEGDGKAGLRAAKERRPSGIILDIRLPDLDGWHIMDELRADRTLASIPVHFVSAMEGADRGLAMGAVGYLRKPASRRDLVRVVQALAPSAAARAARVLLVENGEVADASVLAELAGEKVDVRRVGTAAEALDALRAERFGCVILDLTLPDMDGLDLLEALHQHLGPATPSIVVHTARSLTKAEAKRVELHADAVVLKDGSSGERLLDEVRLFLRRLAEGLGSGRPLAEGAGAGDVRLAGKQVLLVDDDMRTVYALSAALRAKGVEVVVADTGRAAIAAMSERPDIEAILMDIMMPEMDGYEAMRQIRADERFRTLPIIALTAKAMKGDREKCVEAGATDYLPKPVDAKRLLAMLQLHLVKAPPKDVDVG